MFAMNERFLVALRSLTGASAGFAAVAKHLFEKKESKHMINLARFSVYFYV